MSVEAPNKTQSLIIDELNSFYKLYFSHPWWAGKAMGRLRLIFLPSAWLIEKSEAMGVRIGPKEFETRFQFGESGEITSTTEYINGRIIGASDRGYDCYYFLNAVRAEKYGEQKFFGNEDIERVLFLPLDIDRGECPDIREAAWITESSRGKWHVITAVEQGSESRDDLAALAKKWCEHFGSDPVSDAKRILRLPGTRNWKGGAGAADDGATMARLARGDLNYHPLGASEVEGLMGEYPRVERAERPKTARIKTVNGEGEDEEGSEGGEWGHWSLALEAAEQDKWTVPVGVAWHEPLLVWGAQMVHDELSDKDIEANLRRLAEGGAFEGSYTDSKRGQIDLEKVVRSTVGKYAPEVRAEVAAFDKEFLGVVVEEEGEGVEGVEGAEVAKGAEAKAEMEAGAVEEVIVVQRDRREKVVVLNEDLATFARKLAAQWPDEDRADYLKWLMRVGLLVNQALLKDRGVFEPAAAALAGRLREYRMMRVGDLVVPRWKNDEILRPQWLDEDEQRAFLVEYASAAALAVYSNRKEIGALPDTVGVGGKKRRVFFQCKASVLSALVNGIAGKILLGGIDGERNHAIVVLQDGVFDIGREMFVRDEFTGRNKWWTQARWIHANPIAQRFVGAGAELNGGALLGMPMLRAYLEDTFVGEENRVTREELIPRIIGYCMIRGNPAQKFFTFIGPGGSGKGVLCEIIESLVGDWNAARVNYSCLAAPWGFAPLEGKLVCVADEAESATRKVHDEVMSRIKAYTGSDNFALRGMREVERTVETTAKILITCNKDLAANDSGGALARRMVCLSFDNVKEVRGQQENLGRRIVESEGDRIASWAVSRMAAALKGVRFNALFEVGDAGALAKGKERMSEMIDPMANFIQRSLVRVEGTDVRASVVLEVLRILIDMERMRHPGGQIGAALRGAMERAKFGFSKEETGNVYLNSKINMAKVLGAYEIDRESFARAVRSGPLGLSGSVELGLEDEAASGQSEMDWEK